MKATKFATLGQIPVWVFCVVLLLIIGCVVFQPQQWGRLASHDVAGESLVQYAIVKADEVVVYRTDTGGKFHRADCRHLERSRIKTTVLDARQAELTACKVCKPPQ